MVYILRLCSNVIYVGCSTDLEQRLRDHQSGKACRTTKLEPPTDILRVEIFTSFPEARERELPLKRWSRAKKEALIKGDHRMLKDLSRSHD
ncbi:MAG: GIY-YIG nuclease family protein [Cephaloticoccus sp.]|nr:GIY-YIG nuclease family protein [Cephaloticoccus sp.]MCF7760638.1 GIY-YIG nuclease family protein [Cephaloticoccus sp.]